MNCLEKYPLPSTIGEIEKKLLQGLLTYTSKQLTLKAIHIFWCFLSSIYNIRFSVSSNLIGNSKG